MAVIKEFWTDGNLIINNLGGLNFNTLPTNQSWELKLETRQLILNVHGRSIDGTKYHPLLDFKIRENKVNEILEFFNRYNVRYRLIKELF